MSGKLHMLQTSLETSLVKLMPWTWRLLKEYMAEISKKYKFCAIAILSDGEGKSFLTRAGSILYGDIAIHEKDCVNLKE